MYRVHKKDRTEEPDHETVFYVRGATIMRCPVNPVSLLYVLSVVILLDIMTTLIGVGLMGATELNPFCAMLGFPLFMLIKVFVSGACVYALYKYSIPLCPSATVYGMGFAIGFYTIVLASNLLCLVGHIS